MIEKPSHLGRRIHRIQRQTCQCLHLGARRSVPRCHGFGCARVLPAQHRTDGLPGRPLPCHHGLALIREGDGLHDAVAQARQCVMCSGQERLEDLLCVLLHLAGAAYVECDRDGRPSQHGAGAGFADQGLGGGGAGIQGDDHGGHGCGPLPQLTNQREAIRRHGLNRNAVLLEHAIYAVQHTGSRDVQFRSRPFADPRDGGRRSASSSSQPSPERCTCSVDSWAHQPAPGWRAPRSQPRTPSRTSRTSPVDT